MTSKKKKKRLRKKAQELTTDEVMETIFGKKGAEALRTAVADEKPKKSS